MNFKKLTFEQKKPSKYYIYHYFTYVKYKDKQNFKILFQNAYLAIKIKKNREMITIRKGECWNWRDREHKRRF